VEAHAEVSVVIYMLETMYRAAIFVKGEFTGFFLKQPTNTINVEILSLCTP